MFLFLLLSPGMENLRIVTGKTSDRKHSGAVFFLFLSTWGNSLNNLSDGLIARKSRLFGFLLGSTAAGASVYYYILEEYKISNEMLTEDIYVCKLHNPSQDSGLQLFAWSFYSSRHEWRTVP